jgi:CDP-4-dehydro-6-deoxyglucose reductase, E3
MLRPVMPIQTTINLLQHPGIIANPGHVLVLKALPCGSLREMIMSQATISGILEAFEDATPAVRRLFISIEAPRPFRFAPGQYVAIKIPAPEKAIFRPYSIASSPDPEGRIELCFKHVEAGVASEFLCACTAGTLMEMRGPDGNFTLGETPPADALFIATGTGISPIRSQLQFLFQHDFQGSAQLLFGVRLERDILYRREFERLAERHSGFSFLPTLSRPESLWQGLAGHVQEHVQNLLGNNREPEIFICGHPAMVKEVRTILGQQGIPEAKIHYEKYLSS